MSLHLRGGARPSSRSGPEGLLRVEELERREVPATLPNFSAIGTPPQTVFLAVAQGPGGGQVRVFDFNSATERYHFSPFGPVYTGGVSVATGDVTGDGIPDIVCATGTGATTTVRVFNGTNGARIASFVPFGTRYNSGASIAVGDINKDGKADIVVGGASHTTIKVFSGASVTTATLVTLGRFTAFGTGFSAGYTGGTRVAVGDVDKDSTPDVVAVTASGRGVVAGFSGANIGATNPFQPFSPYFARGVNGTGGGWITAGDVNGDGYADIATGNGGGAPVVRIIDGRTLPLGGEPTLIRSFTLGTTAATGARARLVDLNGNGVLELVAAANTGAAPTVGIFNAATGASLSFFDAFATNFFGGVAVG